MELALWRDIAIVWLSLFCIIGLIIPLAISLFVVKGMHAAVDRTPRMLRQLQGYSRAMRNQTEAASYRVAEPVIQAHRAATRTTTTLQRLQRGLGAFWRGVTGGAETKHADTAHTATKRGDTRK